MMVDDVLSGLPVTFPEVLRRRMAIHEARHAVVGMMVDAGEVISASIASRAVPGGGIQDVGGVFLRDSRFRERTRVQVLDEMAVRLGGLAAEEVLLGDRVAFVKRS